MGLLFSATVKKLLGVFGITGSLWVFLDQHELINEAMKSYPNLKLFTSVLFIVSFVLFLIAFVIDKWLGWQERQLGIRERKQRMRKTEEEIQDLKDNHYARK